MIVAPNAVRREQLDRAMALEGWARELSGQLVSCAPFSRGVTADLAVTLYLDSLAIRSEWSV